MRKVFKSVQMTRLWREPADRKIILLVVPIALLVTISYVLDPGQTTMLALCLAYSVFMVPTAAKGVITERKHVYLLTAVTFPFVAIDECVQPSDTLMTGYVMVLAVLIYQVGEGKFIDELVAARRARERDK